MKRLAIALILSLPSTAFAQSYNLTQSSGSFVSIATSGTPIPITGSIDDNSAAFTLPFTFPFFGSPITAGTPMAVNTNGLLLFGPPDLALDNIDIPNSTAPNGFVAGFWSDLIGTVSGGGIYQQTSGSTGNRVLTVEWSNYKLYSSSASNTFSFQVKLYESNGRIEILYGPQSGGTGTGATTIGVESPTGTAGVQAMCSPGCTFTDITPGTLMVFTPGAGPPPMRPDIVITNAVPDTTAITPGQTVNIEYEVRNAGTVLAPGFDVTLFASPDPTVTTSDQVLASDSVSSLSGGATGGGTITFAVPAGAPPGTLYVALIADTSGSISEVDENNNTFNLGAVTIGGMTMGTIRVTTTSLPTGRVGTSYSARLTSTGGTNPSWAVINGNLPSGVTLSSAGTLSGTPSSQGTFAFRVQATQTNYTPGTADLVLTVNGGGGGQLQLDTTMLPAAQVGQPFSTMLAASGGAPPYAFQIISASPTRPVWLMMNSTGAMSGTPTGPGEYQLEISVFDSMAGSTSGSLALVVTEMRPLEMVTTMLPNGQTGVAYSARVEARGGRQPYMFSISSGMLPGGLSLSSESGEITGTPMSTGMSTFEVTVRDSAETEVKTTFRVNVTMMVPLRITSPDRVAVRLNTAASVTLTAEGGTPPYEWSITEGELPAGLTLSTSGMIGGTATSSIAQQVTVRVSDGARANATQRLTVEATSDGNPTNGGTDPNGVRRGGRGGAPTARNSGCSATGVPGPDEGGTLFGVLLLLGVATWRIRRTRSG